jgi:hypothetical protein
MLYKQYSGSLLFKRYQMLVKYSNLNQTKLKEGEGQERVGIKCFKPGLVDKPVFFKAFLPKNANYRFCRIRFSLRETFLIHETDLWYSGSDSGGSAYLLSPACYKREPAAHFTKWF